MVLPQISKPDLVGEAVGEQLGGGPRNQDLARMSGCEQAGQPVRYGAEIIAFALNAQTRMERHPYPDRSGQRPRLRTHRMLESYR